MTSKAVISQLEVNERRLKGIYDQLESGNFKKAIAEADKVLKKNPNLLPARVLKGLSLYRTGKSQEAFSIVNEVVSCNPTDESTLSTLTYFFKESNQKNRIVDIYEEAFKQFPNREDICTNLFNCHVKSFNYLSQQKVAIQLRKINASHMEYGMWPMIGNVLHGVYNKDLRLVKLGEAMLTKYFNSNPILSAERIEFLIYIYEKLGKVEECYNWLCGLVLKDVVENDQNKNLFDRYKVDLLQKLSRTKEACQLQWELIVQNPDDICMWRNYIDNAVALNLDSKDTNSLESVVDKLNHSDNNRIAIKVAMIHLSMSLMKVNPELAKKFGSKADKIVNYFVRFGDRSSCFYDIYTILCTDTFTNLERKEVLDRITAECSPLPINDNKEVERHYFVKALRRLVEGSTAMDISELIETYRTVLHLSVDFGPTEIKPCDNFVKLAVSCYYDKWLSNINHTSLLIDSVTLLREALNTSPANYNLRLQLSHLYGILRCQDLAIGQFNDLEIKQLMWDSLGHHYIIPSLSVPLFAPRVQFLAKNLTRKRKNKLEIEDNLVTCYKLGNYGRIPEIIDFHKSIDASVMSKMSEVEIIYINTVLKSNNCDELFECCGNIDLPEVESTDPEFDIVTYLSSLKDFRDLTTSPDFAPLERHWSDEEKKSSFRHIVLWIAQRSLLLRAYYSAAKVTMETVVKLDILSHDSVVSFTEERSTYYNVLLSCRRSLTDVWSQMANVSGSYSNLASDLTGCVEPPHNIFFPHSSDLMSECIAAILTFHDVFVRRLPAESLCDWSHSLVSPISKVIGIMTNIESGHGDLFSCVPQLIANLTVVCEMFSFVTMVISMLENMTKPMRPKIGGKRKGKKKIEGTGDCDGTDTKFGDFRQLVTITRVDTIPGSLVVLLDSVVQVIDRSKVAIVATTTTLDNGETTVCPWSSVATVAAIGDSWTTSLDEAAQLLGTKRAQLELLRQVFEHELLQECVAKARDMAVQ